MKCPKSGHQCQVSLDRRLQNTSAASLTLTPCESSMGEMSALLSAPTPDLFVKKAADAELPHGFCLSDLLEFHERLLPLLKQCEAEQVHALPENHHTQPVASPKLKREGSFCDYGKTTGWDSLSGLVDQYDFSASTPVGPSDFGLGDFGAVDYSHVMAIHALDSEERESADAALDSEEHESADRVDKAHVETGKASVQEASPQTPDQPGEQTNGAASTGPESLETSGADLDDSGRRHSRRHEHRRSHPPGCKKEKSEPESGPAESTDLLDHFRIGIYTIRERMAKIKRFREKRRHRVWAKTIHYPCRKNLAAQRPRVKGRFVKQEDTSAD